MKKRKADIWVNFYDKIKEIKILNKSGNDINHSTTGDKIFNNLLSEINLKTLFTNEENFGKCLDLHELYHEYINIPNIFNNDNNDKNKVIFNMENIVKLNYLNYIKNIDNFKNIPIKVKKSEEYIKYIKHLAQYLKSFFVKIYPLINFNEIQDIIDSKFEDDQEHIDKSIGLNEEEEIKKNELFCNICNKSFAKETLMDAHMKSKKHLKKVNLSKNNDTNNINKNSLTSDFNIYNRIKNDSYMKPGLYNNIYFKANNYINNSDIYYNNIRINNIKNYGNHNFYQKNGQYSNYFRQ
jgi:splicing factor 3A subunit 3